MKTGWCWVSGSWYYLNTSGVMQTGLQTINGKQYYLSSSGDMQVGWHNIGDDTYFFASSGARQTINRRALVLGETSTSAVPIEDVNAMEKVFSNQNFSEVVRFPDKTKAEIIANMQELFKSSIENDVNHLYLSWRKKTVRYLLVAIKRYLQVGIHFKIKLFRLWQTPILTEKSP